MKRRTKRDLGVLVGAIAIIGVVAFANSQLSRSGLAEQFNEMREELEIALANDALIKWDVIRKTKGSLRNGGKFAEELRAYDGQEGQIIGFMVPNQSWRDVQDFLLLPIPLECYFCKMPPERDVLFVQMREGETTPIVNEPIVLSGTFNIHEGPDQKFFYTMTDATFGAALDGGDLTKKRIAPEHMMAPGDHKNTQKNLRPAEPVKRDNTD